VRASQVGGVRRPPELATAMSLWMLATADQAVAGMRGWSPSLSTTASCPRCSAAVIPAP
jgi:hypothetical protein